MQGISKNKATNNVVLRILFWQQSTNDTPVADGTYQNSM